jgi:hypothetical protein
MSYHFRMALHGRSAEQRMTSLFEKSKDGIYTEDKIVHALADYCLVKEIGVAALSKEIGFAETAISHFLNKYERGEPTNMSLRMAVAICDLVERKLVIQNAT